MVDIQFQNIEENLRFSSLGEISAQATLKHFDLPKTSELSILFCDDANLLMLNKKHRGIEKSTDVLSFANDGFNPESGESYLGDIAISVERAGDQAKQTGHSLDAEIQLLVVHGLLHLLGYTHNDGTGKKSMWDVQNKILDALEVTMDRGNIGS